MASSRSCQTTEIDTRVESKVELTGWTIESELLARSGAASLVDAINTLGLLKESCRSVEVACECDWRPGGAETYIYNFSVTSPRESASFVLKSVTALNPIGSVGDLAEEWLSRRQRLEAVGVSTPRFFGIHKATILEEFVPFSLSEAIESQPTGAAEFKGQCVLLAKQVARGGFLPRGLFRDLRSRGRDVVMIDFGADLGAFQGEVDGSTALLRLQEFASGQGWIVDEVDRSTVLNDEGSVK
jgi:hypothetical protein